MSTSTNITNVANVIGIKLKLDNIDVAEATSWYWQIKNSWLRGLCIFTVGQSLDILGQLQRKFHHHPLGKQIDTLSWDIINNAPDPINCGCGSDFNEAV